ncbi:MULTISPECIES: hypothetical protein [unclassified Allobranchiibius]|uniref:hypothetical protein n=1 Tax=unclassified Allobranchiibius TaxID=2649857 RepID=UPI001AA0F73B|nr:MULTISPECIES: hypothetical protein [unclassified Allobranchiibius]MBO1766771.1 hypothetical protein [Allobranchiibius sp. GilTou38]UIJ33706.1 hypothetical protein LVQ62_11110 [Allobranchiibius sp. GilTou73]
MNLLRSATSYDGERTARLTGGSSSLHPEGPPRRVCADLLEPPLDELDRTGWLDAGVSDPSQLLSYDRDHLWHP